MINKHKGALIVTSIVILLPVLIGLLLWNRLPEQIPTHWNIHGEIDAWSSKPFAVFGLPAMLLVIHWICLLVRPWVAATSVCLRFSTNSSQMI